MLKSANEIQIGDKIRQIMQSEEIIVEVADVQRRLTSRGNLSEIKLLFRHPKIQPFSSRDPQGQRWVSIPASRALEAGLEVL